jgi:hypothetical protein
MKSSLAHAPLALVLFLTAVQGAAPDREVLKTALQEFNEFIGDWNGSGAPEKPRPDAKETWTEKISWSWRFHGDDAWLTLTVTNGRHLKSGELRYLPAKKRYQLTVIDKGDHKAIFDGELRKGYLVMERVDPATKETQQLMMNTAGDGARFVYRLARKPEGRTLFVRDYQVACTKEGETLGVRAKKVECVISGGLGTIPVSYQGTTYYVCCSGCRDAFNENPAKYVKEYEARKKQ